MHTAHKIVIGSSQQMPELPDGSVQLMVTSPPYPMIQMWDGLFAKADPKIAELWQKLECGGKEETVRQIYGAMHDYLGKVWQETYRVLVDGGIACINIGDATRTVNGKFQLYPNTPESRRFAKKSGSKRSHTFYGKNPQTNQVTKEKAPF